MNRSVLRVVAGIVLFLVLITAVSGGLVWWKISGLKESLVAGLGKALNADVKVASPLELDVWKGELHAAGITLTNLDPSAPWEKGEISQATVRFHLLDLLSSPMPVSVEVSSWSLVLHQVATVPGSSETPPTGTASAVDSSAPASARNRIQVTQLTVSDGSVQIELAGNREFDLEGVAFDASDNGAGVWTTHLQAASVKSGAFETGTSSVLLLGDKEKVTFSNLRMVCGQGLIAGDGEAALGGDHKATAALQATDIPVDMLVAVEWQMKVSGLATVSLNYEGNDLAATAKGKLTVNQAKINILPWLGKLTALVGLPDISNVELDKAASDFEWKEHVLHLTNLDLRKDGVTRITGDADIDSTGHLDGKIKLGLPSTVTAKWPQLQDKVFSTQLEDYNWADVHVTGTPDHLQEDLTSRVVAVGLDQGSGLLDAAAQKASDLWEEFHGELRELPACVCGYSLRSLQYSFSKRSVILSVAQRSRRTCSSYPLDSESGLHPHPEQPLASPL